MVMTEISKQCNFYQHQVIVHATINHGEGAELEAIKSATLTFADSLQRPCQLILEMKTNDSYKEAFWRIFDLGYTDVINVDNGVTGDGSYPPIGGHYASEGNYEFRLGGEEYEQCIERVRLATCPTEPQQT